MRVSKTLKEKLTKQVPASARMVEFRYSPACMLQMSEASYYGRVRLQPLS